MTKNEMIDLLNNDLRNEYKHMHFYLHSAIVIQGLHREELREFLLKEAASEMDHVTQFADLIVGLSGRPEFAPNQFETGYTDPLNILQYALRMEEEVISNYVLRMDQATELGDVDGRWIEIFLEDQIMNSRKDADHLTQMIRGI